MLAKVLSSAVYGLDAYLVDVEVDIATGLPQFNIVGLPDLAVKESKDRVRAALIAALSSPRLRGGEWQIARMCVKQSLNRF